MPPKRTHVTLADVAGHTGLGPAFRDGGRRAGGIIDAITATEPSDHGDHRRPAAGRSASGQPAQPAR